MNPSRRLFAIAALFALGMACWSGLGSSAQEKGKVQKGGQDAAQQPPKWEYKVSDLTGRGQGDEAAEKILNKLGEEGWELAGTTTGVTHTLIFKRPKK